MTSLKKPVKPQTHVCLPGMSSPVLKRRNLSLKRRKSTIKVDENDGMFEKECETEEVDDDLPATQ